MENVKFLPYIEVPVLQDRRIKPSLDRINHLIEKGLDVAAIIEAEALKKIINSSYHTAIFSTPVRNRHVVKYNYENLLQRIGELYYSNAPQFPLPTEEIVRVLFGFEDLPGPPDQIEYVFKISTAITKVINNAMKLSEEEINNARNNLLYGHVSRVLSYLDYMITKEVSQLQLPHFSHKITKMLSKLIYMWLPFSWNNDLIFLKVDKNINQVYYPLSKMFYDVNNPLVKDYLYRHGFYQLGKISLKDKDMYKLHENKITDGIIQSDIYKAINYKNITTVAPLALSIFNSIKTAGKSFKYFVVYFTNVEYIRQNGDIEVQPQARPIKKAFNLDSFKGKTRKFDLLYPEDIADALLAVEEGFHPEVYKYDQPQSGTSILDLTGYTIVRTIPLMGAGGSKGTVRNVGWAKLRDYKCDEGNCLIALFDNVSRIKKPHGYAKTLRDYLGLPPAPAPIPIDIIKKLCVIHELNAKIYYTDQEGKVELLYEHFILSSWMTVEILFENFNHYSHIIERYSKKSTPEKLIPLKPQKETLLVYFDYETVFDLNSDLGLHAYQLGWIVSDPDRTDSDFTNEEVYIARGSYISEPRKKYMINCLGQTVSTVVEKYCNPTDEFLNWLGVISKTYKCILIGFNNAKFDNWLLAEGAANRRCLTDIFITGNQLRDVRILNHNTLDVAHLIPGMSLDACCDSFKTKPVKVAGYDHMFIQDKYNKGELYQWYSQNQEEADHYLKTDVRATASLFVKLRASLKELCGLDILEGGKNKTIGGLSWNALLLYHQNAIMINNGYSDNKENRKIIAKYVRSQLPVAKNKKDDDFIRRSMYGGRCQTFCPRGTTIEGMIAMIDAKSLYPTVATGTNRHLIKEPLYGWFPLGDYTFTEDYRKDKIGVYNCVIISQPIRTIIPLRCDPLPLNWTPDIGVPINCVLTSPDINSIIRHGGKVKIGDGIYWENMTDSFFNGYFQKLIDDKNKQDDLKNNNDPDYNPAQRECDKLAMNSVTGKCSQRNFSDQHILSKSIKESVELLEKCQDFTQIIGTNKEGYIILKDNFDDIMKRFGSQEDDFPVDKKVPLDKAVNSFSSQPTFTSFGNGYILFSGQKPLDKVYNPKKAKPAILSSLIYSYARMYMYDLLISKRDGLLMDTDSYGLRYDDYLAFREEYPELDPANHGGAARLGDFEEELGVKKKGKFIVIAPKHYHASTDHNSDKKTKNKVKGVNPKDVVLYSKTLPELSDREKFEIYNNPGELGFKLQDDYVKFFEMNRDQKVVYVLCSQITKSLEETKGFSLTQRYIIKEIN